MKQIAIYAESINHHPEWKNIYNIVEVTLSTHDCNGISLNDIQMATKMDEIATSILPMHQSSSSPSS
jgi:4a-hydroxytetrahydrobiopterin dehydratase